MTSTPCSGPDRDLWSSDDPHEIALCREACWHCPILTDCAQSAVDMRPTGGVWATVHITSGGARSDRSRQYARLRKIAAGNVPSMPASIRTAIDEHAVLRLRADGATLHQIAEALHLSVSTVHRHTQAAS